jgi:hypothetical protein
MRKVTKKTVTAFLNRKKVAVGNTVSTGNALYLHGHKIAYWEGDNIVVSFCGWPTSATKERLNGLLWLFKGCSPFYHKNSELMMDDDVPVRPDGEYEFRRSR